MNKYQEALDNVKIAPSFMGGNTKYSTHINSATPFSEDITTLQELVDKETPKKLKSKTDKDGRLLWICPNCGDVYMKFWSDVETITCRKYCDECGQKLYFGDE